MTINVPKICDKYPEQVEIIAKNTKATNGSENGKDVSYQYVSSTGELKINIENKADENGNIYTDNIEGAKDEVSIICYYDSECYTDSEEKRVIEVTGTVNEIIDDGFDSSILGEFSGKTELTKNISGLISTSEKTGNLYNGYINANKQNGTDYETEYTEDMELNISYKNISDEILIDVENKFLESENEEEIEADPIIYKNSKINKQNVLNILGEDGFLQILSTDGNVLLEINKDTQENEQGIVEVSYPENTNKILIKTSKANSVGIINIENTKALKADMANLNYNKIKINSNIKCSNKVEGEENKEVYTFSNSSEEEIKQAESNVNVSIDKKTLTNSTQNDVIITAQLQTNSSKYNLFKEPIIEIELPSQIEKVVLGEVKSLYDTELQITNSQVIQNDNGNKVIRIELAGTQTKYIDNMAQTGKNILIPATLIVSKGIESTNANIKTTYTNEVNGEKITQTKNMEVKINSVFETEVRSVQTMGSEAQNITKETQTTTQVVDVQKLIDENALEVTTVAQIGSEEIENGDTIYEGEVIKYVVNIKNTTDETINNISVIGEVPEGTVYGKVDRGDFWMAEYKYVEYPEITEYTLGTVSLEPGESKTGFYEVVVKDLDDSETSKEITTKVTTKINDTEYNSQTLQNTIKQAGIKTNLKSYIDRGEKSKFSYVLEITNTGTETLNNINVETNQLQKEMNILSTEIYYGLYTGGGTDGEDSTETDTTSEELEEIVSDENTTEETEEDNSFGTVENGMLKGTIPSLEAGKSVSITMYVKAENFDSNVNECELKMSAKVWANQNEIYRTNENRRTAYPEYVTAEISCDKEGERVNEEEIVTYNITVKNPSKIKTTVNIQDYLPQNLEGISLEYEKYVLEEGSEDNVLDTEYDIEAEANIRYTTESVNLELNANIENEADIDEYVTIPAGKTLNLTLKAVTDYVSEDTEIQNYVIVSGKYIKNTTSNIVKFTLAAPEEIDEEEPGEGGKEEEIDENESDMWENDKTNEEEENSGNSGNSGNNGNENGSGESSDETHSISGLVWKDENKDGKRQSSEELISGTTVKLYNADTNVIATDSNGTVKTTVTDQNGQYRFEGIKQGNYLVLFEYDTSTYTPTKYQSTNVDSNLNSDAIKKEVSIDGKVENVGLTDILQLKATDLENIDLGLVKNAIFDLKLDKYISKITVSNKEGNKAYNYEDGKLAKVEIASKYIKGTTITIEYTIRVTNEGDIESYANEVIDYLPNELKFSSELNSSWYKDTSGKLINTSLANELIKPGESKDIKLVLTKQMTEDWAGTIKNGAEIGKSSNSYDIQELDSTANNKAESEDDYSEAEVIISLKTGILTYTVITILAIGVLILVVLCIKGRIKLTKKSALMSLIVIIFAVSLVATKFYPLTEAKDSPATTSMPTKKNVNIKYEQGSENTGTRKWYSTPASENNGKSYRYYCTDHSKDQCYQGNHYYNLVGTDATTISKTTSVVRDDITLTKSIINDPASDTTLVGKYHIKCNYTGAEITEIKITYKLNGESQEDTNLTSIKTKSGNTKTDLKLNDGTNDNEINFYVKVPSGATNVKVKVVVSVSKSIKVVKKVKYTYYYKCVSVSETHRSGAGCDHVSGVQPMQRTKTKTETDYDATEKSVSFGTVDTTGEIKIVKRDADDNSKLTGAKFTIKKGSKYYKADGTSTTTETKVTVSSENGLVIKNLSPGTYTVTEVGAPSGYNINLQSGKTKTISVTAGNRATATFYNKKYGNLTIMKVDSSTDEGVNGILFNIGTDDDKYIKTYTYGTPSTITWTTNVNEAYKFETKNGGIIELKNIPVDLYTATEVGVSNTNITVAGITAPASKFYVANKNTILRSVFSNANPAKSYLIDVTKRILVRSEVQAKTNTYKSGDYIAKVYNTITGATITSTRKKELFNVMYKTKNGSELSSVTTTNLNTTIGTLGFDDDDVVKALVKAIVNDNLSDSAASTKRANNTNVTNYVKSIFAIGGITNQSNSLQKYYENVLKGNYSMLFKNPMGGKMEITKKDESTSAALTAKFRLYTKVGNTTYYYNDSTKSFSTSSSTFTVTGSKTLSRLPALTYTVEEVEAPAGYDLQYQKDNNLATKTVTVQLGKYNAEGAFVYTVSRADFVNARTVRLSGKVWEDREYVDKDGNKVPYNSLYDSDGDKLMENVRVSLIKADTSKERYTYSNYMDTVKTDKNGYYEFKNVKIDDLPYLYIEFMYNGMVYECVPINLNNENGSKVSEATYYSGTSGGTTTGTPDSRLDKMNSKFEQITVGQSLPNNKQLNYDTTQVTTEGQEEQISKINYGSNLEYGWTSPDYTENKETNSPVYGDDKDYITFANTFRATSASTYYTKERLIGYKYNRESNNIPTIDNIPTIGNINLGLKRREEPDLAVSNELYSAKLTVPSTTGTEDHIYNYADRNNKTYWADVQSGLVNPAVQWGRYNLPTSYTRPLYASDISKGKENGNLSLKVIYKVTIINQATTLKTTVNSITDYFDNKYEFVQAGTEINSKSEISKTISTSATEAVNGTSYNKINDIPLDLEIGPSSDVSVYLEFRVKNDEIYKLLGDGDQHSDEVKLDNIVEVTKYSTKSSDGKVYAGIDKDSAPGNFDITKAEEQKYYEDDTSRAPGLKLVLGENRTTSGIVFLDETNGGLTTGEIREGDGKYNEDEAGIDGVKVTLYETNASGNKGNIATYYDTASKTWKEATTSSSNGGKYEISGYLPGSYILEFEWGGQKITTGGEEKTITVQDYKSTIVNEQVWNDKNTNEKWYKDEFKKQYTSTNPQEWSVDESGAGKEVRTSDAVDNWETREEIDNQTSDVTYGLKAEINKAYSDSSYDHTAANAIITTMKSETPKFKVGVEKDDGESKCIADKDLYEFNEDGTPKIEGGYIVKKDQYKNNATSVDFGIVERARQVLELNKYISNAKIKLSTWVSIVDVELDADGNITNSAKYVQSIPESRDNVAETITREKVKIEIDDELIQGATLELSYKLKVTNTSELDYTTEAFYKYGQQCNSSSRAENQIVTLTPAQIIDYMDNDMAIDIETIEAKGWNLIEKTNRVQLYDTSKEREQLLTDAINNYIKDKEHVAINENLKDNNLTPKDGNNTAEIEFTSNKSLAVTTNGTSIENDAEIIQIKKTGGSTLTTTPGNYVPSDLWNTTEADDSRADLEIIPPTGLSTDYIAYIIIAISSLGILAVGIVLIKKFIWGRG